MSPHDEESSRLIPNTSAIFEGNVPEKCSKMMGIESGVRYDIPGEDTSTNRLSIHVLIGA